MLTDQTKRRFAAVAMFLAPVGIVWVSGNFLGGPATVEAGIPQAAIQDPGQVPGTGPANATPAQLSAADHVVSLREQSFGPTPLYHTERGDTIEPTTPGVPGVPQISVGMILASSSGNMAMIDGERYRVGDALGDTGWTIIEIDAVGRSVTIDDREYDRTRTFYVDGPSGLNIRTTPSSRDAESRGDEIRLSGGGDPPAPEEAEEEASESGDS